MQTYTTLFDIGQKGFPWLFSAGGLILAAFAVVVMRRRKAGYKWTWAAVLFGFLWSLVSFSSIHKQSRDAQGMYAAERYLVAEGPVEDYQEQALGKGECFSVQRKRFCYSDYVITPGFNNTAWHGGSIRAGLPVRVSYVGDTIFKLEVRSDMAPSPAEIRMRELKSIGRYITIFGTFPAIVLAINAALWLYDRLRRKTNSLDRAKS